jgi:shikimate 5-dehydrogenase
MTWSRDCGASVSNGFGMLVEQAAEAFLIWEDARPKTRMAWPRLCELLS